MTSQNDTVYIVTADLVFARMLELEIQPIGFTPVTCGAVFPYSILNEDAAVISKPLFICDAESADAACLNLLVRLHMPFALILPRNSDETILSARNFDFVSGDNALILKRPFRISLIRDFLFENMSAYIVNQPHKPTGYMRPVCEDSHETDNSAGIISGNVLNGIQKTPHQQYLPSSDLFINCSTKSVSFRSVSIQLTAREFELLYYLYERRGHPISRGELSRSVWRNGDVGISANRAATNVTDVYIKYLRQKFDEKFGVKMIITVRGKGYLLR